MAMDKKLLIAILGKKDNGGDSDRDTGEGSRPKYKDGDEESPMRKRAMMKFMDKFIDAVKDGDVEKANHSLYHWHEISHSYDYEKDNRKSNSSHNDDNDSYKG